MPLQTPFTATITPVFCYRDYQPVEVFHAFDTKAAVEMTSENWDTQPNGFYIGSSREIPCCILTGRPFAVNEPDMAGNVPNPYAGV